MQPTASSVAVRTTDGRLKVTNATESNDAVALGQAVTLTGNQNIAGFKNFAGGFGVNTTSSYAVANISNGSGKNLELGWSDQLNTNYIQSIDRVEANGLDLTLYTTGSGTLKFVTGDVERMRITSAGNVGIGVSSPEAALQVNGKIKTYEMVDSRGYSFFGASAGPFGLVTNLSTLCSLSPDGTSYGYGVSTNIQGGLDIMANQLSQPIRFYAGEQNIAPTERLRVNGDGKLLSPNGSAFVGTVSNSGLSAIIQRGSNANGEFVRFADGTQICTTRLSTAHGARVTTITHDWVFPVPFNAAQVITSGSFWCVDDGFDYRNGVLTQSTISPGVTSAQFTGFDFNKQTFNFSLFVLTAIGRWY